MAALRVPLALGILLILVCLASWTFLGVWQTLLIVAIFCWSVGIHFDAYLLKERENSILVITSAAFGTVVAGGAAVYIVITGDITTLWSNPLAVIIGLTVGVAEVVWLLFYFEALRVASQRKDFDEEVAENATAAFFQIEALFGIGIALLIPIFRHEVPTSLSVIVGGSIVVFAAFWLNFNEDTKRLNWPVVWRMLVATAIIAAIALMFAYATEDLGGGFAGTAFWMGMGIFLAGSAILITNRRYQRELKDYLDTQASLKDTGLIILNEIFDQAGILMFQLAAILGSTVVAVQAAKAVQPAFILLIGVVIALVAKNDEETSTEGKSGRFWSTTKTVLCVVLLCVGSVPIMMS